jgi:hypothetical protein
MVCLHFLAEAHRLFAFLVPLTLTVSLLSKKMNTSGETLKDW